ncbi:hypothetical protein [Cohaesibacter celericrescens]|uniref:hypothetical protein n=1 Tax=Cohaesibacter celericrescens TaxID=2067669 RepID=UPI0035699C8C
MKYFIVAFSILLFAPTASYAGADVILPLLEAEPKVDAVIDSPAVQTANRSFELRLQGEQLPNESVNVSAYEIDPFNETEELVLTQYSGEDGCCTDIVIFTNSLDGWKIVDFSWGMEEGTSAQDFILDLDGDGTSEVVIDKIYSIEDGHVSSKECSSFEMIGTDGSIKRCTGF